MHRDMFKIQDGVAIVEKLNFCKENKKIILHRLILEWNSGLFRKMVFLVY